MTKKKKSNRTVDKADKNQHVARHGDFPHDAFDIALRRYAHPAAVSDHNLLTPGGPAWKRMRTLAINQTQALKKELILIGVSVQMFKRLPNVIVAPHHE